MKFLLLAPFLLLPATVFIIDNRLANGVVSGKYFWFYGSMGLVSIATLIYSITNKQLFRFSLTDIFVFLFAGSVFLPIGFFGDASANTTKLTLLVLLLILYFSLRIILTPNTLKETYKLRVAKSPLGDLGVIFFIITGLVEAVWGLLQLYGFKPSQHALFKLTGSFFNPGPYAGYLAVVFPMTLYYFVQNGTQMTQMRRIFADNNFKSAIIHLIRVICVRFIACVTCIAIILVLPAAMSRASWLAAIAGSIVVIAGRIPFSRYLSLVTKKSTKFAVLLLILCVSAAAFAGMYHLKKNSADGRLLTWKISLTALAKHPFGVGLGHFPSAYGDAQAAYFASGKGSEREEYVAGNPEYGFNEFLQIAIESGIVSALLFIGILVSAFRNLCHPALDAGSPEKPLKNQNWGVAGSLVALLVFACFSYPFSVLPFPVILVFLLAMSNENGTRMTRIGRIGADIKSKSAIISVISVICVQLILYRQYPVYKAYKQWNNNRMYYQVGMYKEATANYESLYPYLNDRIQFLFEYGRSLSQDFQGIAGQAQNDNLIKSNKVLQQATKISCDPMLYNIMGKNYQAMKEYDLAEQSLLKSTRIVPNRLYPYYLLMKLYIETGDERKAREAAGIVLTKEPKVQSQAVREMREEAGKIRN